jgi:hypothetical protein
VGKNVKRRRMMRNAKTSIGRKLSNSRFFLG